MNKKSMQIRERIIELYSNRLIHKRVKKKEVVLEEGEVANCLYWVESGILRLWHNADGNDITLQFFHKNQMVSSFESFYLNKPSQFTLEAIEDSEVIGISRSDFEQLRVTHSEIEKVLMDYMCERFIEYTNLFLSRIQYSPEQRYRELIKEHSDIVEYIPHYYIASYLGITSVSLSRIRNRIMKEKIDLINNC